MRARAGGRCEGCGKADRVEAHHRLYRSRGGDGGAANGLLLCGSGNTSGCHGKAHSADEGLGFSVPRGSSPADVPVWHARFGLVRLTDDGRVLAASSLACWEHMSVRGGKSDCAWCLAMGREVWNAAVEKGWWL